MNIAIADDKELSTAIEALVRRLGTLIDDYPDIIPALEVSLFYLDHADGVCLPVLSASDDPTYIEAVMVARKTAWTVKELADLHSMSKRGLYDQIQSGRLPSYHIGTLIRLCPGTTVAWFRERIMHPS
jgi:hypothetical protein